jgi:pimeloyl-ACP methyl ester carboxylesterase
MVTMELVQTHVERHSIAYRCAGQGPALVLLHGFTLDSRIWKPQLEGLSDRWKVVAWDAPGAGASSDPPDPFTMAEWAHTLAGFLDVVGIDRAHILGMSWGGVLAQEFYRLCPARALSLILVDTYAGWKGSLPADVCRERLATCLRGASLPVDDFVPQWVPGLIGAGASEDVRADLSNIVADIHPLGFQLMARALADTDTRDLLPRIQVPTLLLWGDADRRSPLAIAEQLRDAIRPSELVVISNAGHVPNLEQPAVFNAQVRHFLDRTFAATSTLRRRG